MSKQKKIAVIQDLSGYGRCSLTVALPVISAMRVQCCPVITSVFSNHTGYPEYFFDDYTDRMPAYIEKWKKLGLTFGGIYTGFLGSEKQIRIVQDFIRYFRGPKTTVTVDPVMGDNGKAYITYTPQLCARMKELAAQADLLTPNVTELCILTDTPYGTGRFTGKQYEEMAGKLAAMGPEKIVITGIRQGGYIANGIYQKDRSFRLHRIKSAGQCRCGTGDLFASIIAADAVNGTDFAVSVKKATAFVKKCMVRSQELEIPLTDGVCFEEFLWQLK